MTAEALRAMLSRRPFEPMRIKMGNGEVFDVRHPEMAMLTKSALVISLTEPSGGLSDKVEFYSYLHIASVETLTGKAA